MTPFSTPLRAFRGMKLPELNDYWNERDRRAREAKADAHQRELNARIDAALIASGNRWPSHWTDAEKADATRKEKQHDRN